MKKRLLSILMTLALCLSLLPVTALATDPAEQFPGLIPGETYWFDLSGADIPGNKNGSLPDDSLHWVPFTYVGTVNAYVLKSRSANDNTARGDSANAADSTDPSDPIGYTYDHSLFIADYNVTSKANWNKLNECNLIFGTTYTSGGVGYTLRVPSAGSGSTGSEGSERGTPQNNEWDAILDKANQSYQNNTDGCIKNWNSMYSWGQDTQDGPDPDWTRATLGSFTARSWQFDLKLSPSVGFRPVLELPSSDTLGSDGLATVTLDLNGGSIGSITGTVNLAVKSDFNVTLPSDTDVTRPDGNECTYFKWQDSSGNFYEPGDTVSAGVGRLTALWKDIEKPVITGLENNKTYCDTVEFDVTDNVGVTSVTANGVELTADANNKYTLAKGVGTVTVVATDNAGNTAQVFVTVNNGHTYEWKSKNGQYWQKCQYCGDETAKKDIPAITISGADVVCKTQDYRFVITVPEGVTNVTWGYDFERIGNSGIEPTIEDGEMVGTMSSDSYAKGETGFGVVVMAQTADGFVFAENKTVTINSEHKDTDKDHICDICETKISGHSGGTATCKDRAICEYCGEEYGELAAHTPAEPVKENEVAATCTDDGSYDEVVYCTVCKDEISRTQKTIPATGHKWAEKYKSDKDGHWQECEVCGATSEKKAHVSGGAATTEHAEICTVCGYEISPKLTPTTGNEPQIKGDNGKIGWEAIKDVIEKSHDGDTITVDMNGTTELPENIISDIAGKDINLVLDMGNGFVWTINGKSVTDPKDVDMGVNRNTTIPVKVVNALTGECEYITVTLAHNGEFGFTAVLTVEMGEKNQGLFANLYYYNDDSEKTEFVCSDKIGSNGTADLTFTHASEYVIVLDDHDHGKADNVSTDEQNPSTGVTMVFGAALISGAAMIISHKKKK